MTTKVPFIDWQTVLVDENGLPTQAFMVFLEAVYNMDLTDLRDVDIKNPTDGQVLTYSAALKKWIPS